jgi:hypothetical protein
MDTVIPSVHRESQSSGPVDLNRQAISDSRYIEAVEHLKQTVARPPETAILDEFLGEKPSDSPEFLDMLKRTLIHYTREDARRGLGLVLSALK